MGKKKKKEEEEDPQDHVSDPTDPNGLTRSGNESKAGDQFKNEFERLTTALTMVDKEVLVEVLRDIIYTLSVHTIVLDSMTAGKFGIDLQNVVQYSNHIVLERAAAKRTWNRILQWEAETAEGGSDE